MPLNNKIGSHPIFSILFKWVFKIVKIARLVSEGIRKIIFQSEQCVVCIVTDVTEFYTSGFVVGFFVVKLFRKG